MLRHHFSPASATAIILAHIVFLQRQQQILLLLLLRLLLLLLLPRLLLLLLLLVLIYVLVYSYITFLLLPLSRSVASTIANTKSFILTSYYSALVASCGTCEKCRTQDAITWVLYKYMHSYTWQSCCQHANYRVTYKSFGQEGDYSQVHPLYTFIGVPELSGFYMHEFVLLFGGQYLQAICVNEF